jgi:hypothetical protein
MNLRNNSDMHTDHFCSCGMHSSATVSASTPFFFDKVSASTPYFFDKTAGKSPIYFFVLNFKQRFIYKVHGCRPKRDPNKRH